MARAAEPASLAGPVLANVNANAAQDADNVGNAASTSTDNTVTFDNTAPTLTVNQAAAQSDPTNTDPINFTATFSEPINTGTFTSGDVTLGGTAGGSKTVTITNPSADNKTFNLAVSGMSSGYAMSMLGGSVPSEPEA